MFIFYYDDGSELHVPDSSWQGESPISPIPKLVFPVDEPDSYVCTVSYVKECDCCEKND